MKYYAVTDDPRELYHYGVKGMKWGQHIFGDKPKSPGYRKAATKLKKLSSSSGVKNSVQRNYKRQMKQQDKYTKAVAKAQRRTEAIEALHNYDKQDSYRKQLARDQKLAKINERLYNIDADRNVKNLQKSIKSEKKLNKYMQQAREGTLRYGNLSENQIRKVQERLSLENQTRQLGGKEKQSWRAQKKEARRAGKLQGIQRGTAAIIEEAARGAAQFGVQGLKNRIMMKSAAKHEGQYEKAKQRAKNKKTNSEIREEVRNKVNQEAYENVVRSGGDAFDRIMPFHSNKYRSALLEEQGAHKEQKRIEDNRKQLQDDLYRKWLLGTKNDTSDNIKERIEKQDEIRELIYGKSKKIETPDQNNPKKKGNFEDYDGVDFIFVPRPVRKVGQTIDKISSTINSSLTDENTIHRKAYRRYTDRVKATNAYIRRQSSKNK